MEHKPQIPEESLKTNINLDESIEVPLKTPKKIKLSKREKDLFQKVKNLENQVFVLENEKE